MGKWIDIKLVQEHPKTAVYGIFTKAVDGEEGVSLGIIKWYPQWRKYCFFPECLTVFEMDCLIDIIQFLDILRQRRRKVKNYGNPLRKKGLH